MTHILLNIFYLFPAFLFGTAAGITLMVYRSVVALFLLTTMMGFLRALDILGTIQLGTEFYSFAFGCGLGLASMIVYRVGLKVIVLSLHASVKEVNQKLAAVLVHTDTDKETKSSY